MQQSFLASANSFVQRAGIAAPSKEGDEAVARMRAVYDKRRKLMVELMRQSGEVTNRDVRAAIGISRGDGAQTPDGADEGKCCHHGWLGSSREVLTSMITGGDLQAHRSVLRQAPGRGVPGPVPPARGSVRPQASVAARPRGAEFEFMRKAGAFDENPVRGAEDVLIVERIKEMLLE